MGKHVFPKQENVSEILECSEKNFFCMIKRLFLYN